MNEKPGRDVDKDVTVSVRATDLLLVVAYASEHADEDGLDYYSDALGGAVERLMAALEECAGSHSAAGSKADANEMPPLDNPSTRV